MCHAENYRLRYAESERAARQALVHYRRAGFSTAGALAWLEAALYFGPTPVEEAIGRCRDELAATQELAAQAVLLTALAGLHGFAAEFTEARELATSARSRLDDLGMERWINGTWTEVAMETARLSGELALAVSLGRASVDRIDADLRPAGDAMRMLKLAQVALEDARADDAATLLADTRGRVPEFDTVVRALALSIEARLLARERGARVRARELAQAAVSLLSDTDALPDRANLELALAEVELLTGRPAQARAAAERAARLYEAKGHVAGAKRAAELTAPFVGA